MAKVSLRTYNREIEALLDRGQLDEVVAHCHHILKSFSKHLETYRLLGKAYLELKKYGDAVDIFSRVLVSVPNDFVAHVGMSIIRDEENKLDDAIWHMERAFETQPSNAAIQGELQRLYGRRDGVQPPRIRMTRGALANMYVQGELYPQAISEIKGVLAEDPGRSDMQSLLARACFRSGQKNEAAEVATALLRMYPYSLDANRVLVEILGVDRPESVQAYRQRVIDLDPYAAHVTGSIFQSNDAPDTAIALERLEWSGQPVSQQADWRTNQGIAPESDTSKGEQPDWLKGGFGEMSASAPSTLKADPDLNPASSSEDNIPEFLRDAGWGKSAGDFDESKFSQTEDETIPPTHAVPIAEGDMPDWVKAMAPPEAAKPAEEGDLPDWISNIGASLNPASEPSAGQPDWLQQMGQSEQPAQPASTPGNQPDWLNQFSGEPEPSKQPSNDFTFLDDLKMDEPQQSAIAPTPGKIDTGELGTSEQERDDSFAWLETLAAKQGATEGLLTNPEERTEEEPEWVKQAKGLNERQPVEQPATLPPSRIEEVFTQPAGDIEELGKTDKERDDSFAWLENLAAKQGATEGLLTKPEDRLEQEPDWVKQAKEIGERPTFQPAGQPPVPSADTASWLRSLDQDESMPTPVSEPALHDTARWLKSLDEADAKPESVLPASTNDTAMWLKNLDEPEGTPPAEPAPAGDLPAWMQNIGEESPSAMTESTVPVMDANESAPWLETAGESEALEAPPKAETGSLPSWLRGLNQEETNASATQDDLPAWLRDETGEVVAEPVKIQPTRSTDWQPIAALDSEAQEFIEPQETPKPVSPPSRPATRKSALKKPESRPVSVDAYKEPLTRKGTGLLTQTVDMILGQARNELSRSNIPGALETYAKLIKRGRFLDEVVFDLREALYRYPVEVSIWQSLGDAYMRANRLQDALDAYTKAEELLR